MNQILDKLRGTDRRSIGRSNEVVREILENPSLFESVFDGLLSDEPVIRMRCADAVEKITTQRPEYLEPFKKRLIDDVASINQLEVRWHVAQLFSRLKLTPGERLKVVTILSYYLQDQSKIVKTFSMQALADIAEQDETLRPEILKKLTYLTQTGSPAMKSRGQKLLTRLKAS